MNCYTKESQTLGMEKLINARELGGYKTLDGLFVKRGLILRSAKPVGASEADLLRLQKVYSLATIADFRMSYERAAQPNPFMQGVEDEWCPIIDENLINPNVSSGEKSDDKSEEKEFARLTYIVKIKMVYDMMYVDFLKGAQGKEGYRKFFKLLLALPEGKSLLFHCSQGKDRTGLGAMLILSALGVDEKTILQDFLFTNVFNADLIASERAMLVRHKVPESSMMEYLTVLDMVDERFMQNALNYMKETYGSVMGYIHEALGITEAEVMELKRKFLTQSES